MAIYAGNRKVALYLGKDRLYPYGNLLLRTHMGRWHTGLLVPYLGIVRMGGKDWVCVVKTGTDNPPLWTITDKDGNRILQTQDGGQTYGYILTGEQNTAEFDEIID